MTRAYRTGNTLIVGSYSYSTIVIGMAYGMILWHDVLSPLEWAGIAVIVASGLVAMRVEKKEQVEEAGFEDRHSTSYIVRSLGHCLVRDGIADHSRRSSAAPRRSGLDRHRHSPRAHQPGDGSACICRGAHPGAYFMHVDYDLSGPKSGKERPPPAARPRRVRRQGERARRGPGKQVVIYDDMAGNYAVRLWWMLRWLGHDKAAVLDGGYPLWVKEGRPVTKEVPARARAPSCRARTWATRWTCTSSSGSASRPR
jgi:hypothetical protein